MKFLESTNVKIRYLLIFLKKAKYTNKAIYI